MHNNGTLDEGERESEKGKSGTNQGPNAEQINSVFDQILLNSGHTNQPENSPSTPKDLDDVVPPPEDSEDEQVWEDYLKRLQSLSDNFEEKKVTLETGLSKKTILGRIEHEKAVHRVFRAIEIIVSEMKIEDAIVTKKATITNPAYIEKDPKDNSEKANKKHNYRTDLILILPGGNSIIFEAKNTTINHFGEALEQVGIYAGAAQVAGEIWVEQRQMNVTNIHTAMIFAKGPEKTEATTHSQNFIEAQKNVLSDQIIILNDPNWIWNLLNLIHNKGLLNKENISTTRSSSFSYLKKTEPKFAFPQLPNSKEIVQKVLENDSKYTPQSPINSADKTDKQTALSTIDATHTELESRDRITLKDMFVTSLSLGNGYSIQQLERDGATKEVIVKVCPLFMYDLKLRVNSQKLRDKI